MTSAGLLPATQQFFMSSPRPSVRAFPRVLQDFSKIVHDSLTIPPRFRRAGWRPRVGY